MLPGRRPSPRAVMQAVSDASVGDVAPRLGSLSARDPPWEGLGWVSIGAGRSRELLGTVPKPLAPAANGRQTREIHDNTPLCVAMDRPPAPGYRLPGEEGGGPSVLGTECASEHIAGATVAWDSLIIVPIHSGEKLLSPKLISAVAVTSNPSLPFSAPRRIWKPPDGPLPKQIWPPLARSQ
ncbi:hypothetical protein CSUB01_03618 [Colletotrichum sublineola]|uniref:Uncharacterized protein n=1 Tax=Colletotrichum sublineola TaxID=1173701 RepID=A0A066XIS4_COLSU|nr:hypothetical protein CSUB01_03618 [Colletotrichum sublineola]